MSALPVTLRQLVVAALLSNRSRAWTAREILAVIRRRGYRVDARAAALELERLYREGSARRGRDGPRYAYQIVALPQQKPGTIQRLNHLRRTWKKADSCGRKTAAFKALRGELRELAARPVRGRSEAEQPEAMKTRNRRYRSELENKARQTRAFCQRAKV